MTFIRGVPGAVNDVGGAYRNNIEDDRAQIWDAFHRRQGILQGFGHTIDPGSLSLTFAAGSAIVEERGTDITGNARGYHVNEIVSRQVVFDAPSAAARNDAVVFAWADPQYGALGASVAGPGPQIVIVKGVSGTTTPRTDTQINTAVGPGGWFRYADVRIDPGNTSVQAANLSLQAPYAGRHIAKVRQTSAQSIAFTTSAVLQWQATDKDPARLVDLATNRINLKLTSSYRVTSLVSFAFHSTSPGGYRRATIRKNASVILRHQPLDANVANSLPTGVLVEDVYDLAAGDFIDIQALHTASGSSASLSTEISLMQSYLCVEEIWP